MTSINQTNIAINQESGFLKNFAQNQLEKRLRKIPRGILVIEDGTDAKSFGEKKSPTDISARIVIHDPGAYRDIAFGGSIGAAEAYRLGKGALPQSRRPGPAYVDQYRFPEYDR